MRPFRWLVITAGIVLLVVVNMSAAVSSTLPECAAPPEIIRFKVDLPKTGQTLRSGQPLVVVAIGSSSTKGIGASDSAHAYPALLAEELHRRFPMLSLNVINKGVGGERAFQMLARFDRDVLPYHPQLVIWQTGSNQTLTSDDVNTYTATLHEGVSRLKSAGADVILIDPQFAPRIIARPTHLLVVDSIDAVAKDMNVAVFRRFALMRYWISSGRYKMGDILSNDGLHMNDLGYSCIASLLADSLTAAAKPERIRARKQDGSTSQQTRSRLDLPATKHIRQKTVKA
jgi:acyl-CoA thioesterase I